MARKSVAAPAPFEGGGEVPQEAAKPVPVPPFKRGEVARLGPKMPVYAGQEIRVLNCYLDASRGWRVDVEGTNNNAPWLPNLTAEWVEKIEG